MDRRTGESVTAGARGGRGKCLACNHPEQDAINRALVLGRPSLRVLAKRYGIGKTSLAEHKANHLTPALITLNQERNLLSGRKVLDELVDLQEHTKAILDAARRSRNMQQALAAISQARQNVELIAKITGELDERPQVTVNLHQTQEWIELRTVIFEVLAPYPDARARLSNRLRLLEGGR